MPGKKKYAYVNILLTTSDGRLVFLEVDEQQHSYEPQLCETTRMWNICESISLADLGAEMNVFWLRINPKLGMSRRRPHPQDVARTAFQRSDRVPQQQQIDTLRSSDPNPIRLLRLRIQRQATRFEGRIASTTQTLPRLSSASLRVPKT